MYLQELYLKNIACFKELNLDFTQPDERKHCPWVVLLGENGSGKSTVLHMLAVALLGRDMIRDVAPSLEWATFARGIKGYVELLLTTRSKEDKKRKPVKDGYQYRVAFELGSTVRTGIRQLREISPGDYDKLQETLYDTSSVKNGWFACGYGPWRTLSSSKNFSLHVADTSRKPQRFATMFTVDHQLTDISNWLINLDYQILKAQEDGVSDGGEAKRTFQLAIDALEKVLPMAKFKHITNNEVIFNDGHYDVPLYSLSDGYRSTTAWVGDLVRRLVEAFPQMANPLEAPGVVLVDEIDIHLHPKWQRTIVERIRELFPNIQFIVSSHSPFVAQDMRKEDKIIVLKKAQGEVTAFEATESLKAWRVDQILTSYLFDLDTTRDIAVAAKSKEYQELLDTQAQKGLNMQQTRQLHELKQWLDENRSGPGETVEENEIFDATRSLLDLLDQQLAKQP